ncbi:MAG TPA: phosphoenolpyruvate--protein phosphotransferase [Chloroflexia bacterium]|nr:phosphoenolpyruvate--protein phosphotransferase [Chloroflexia bacterium]
MQQFDLVIHNATGLHARPARVFVDIAKQYQSTIQVRHGAKQANAKSLISLLQLGVSSGQLIHIDITGVDEESAALALVSAVREGLGEGPAEQVVTTPVVVAAGVSIMEAVVPAVSVGYTAATATLKPETARTIRGVAGAPGIAVGPIYQFKRSQVVINETSAGATLEQARLQAALESARQQLAELREQVLQRGGEDEAAIFEVHRDILSDPMLLDSAEMAIAEGESAARAWQAVINQQAAQMAKLPDPLLSERAADVRDAGERVLRLLTGNKLAPLPQSDIPVIVVAYDLTPSETVALDPQRVLGFCTAVGGPNAHTAILARALGLPAVVSAGTAILELAEGTPIILDGNSGIVEVEPPERIVAAAQLARQEEQARKLAAAERAHAPAITGDGHRVEVVANIGGLTDASQANRSGAEGVGLLRTEFLFLNRSEAPTEEEQFGLYKEIAQALDGKPVIVRTLDIGGDKPIPYLNLPAEENPFLGQRGIRLCLQHPELFRQQLRAILRASAFGKLRIMFPMVADEVEMRSARAMVEEERAALGLSPVEVGIMIEVPSAALMAEELAREADFFSIGTNDLTQYTLAMDRTNPTLATRADGLHPAVLRLIARTVEGAHRAGKWVGVCGELGSDAMAIPILLGLGIDELSVSTPAIPVVKAQIRSLTLADCKERAQQALKCATAAQVRAGG